MFKYFNVLGFLLFFSMSFGQVLTGKQLLKKAISYHDPTNNWDTFKGTLYITMEIPDGSNRDSEIRINLPEEYFYVKAIRDSTITEYTVLKDSCSVALNGNSKLNEAVIDKHNLSCDRANLYKNYYTYLYGLPMKLNDPGTIVHEPAQRKKFKGKDYLVLKVSYPKDIGSDIWYFYFNPKTYAMEIYQFFKTDENGIMKDDSGEYILLTEEEMISGIKMPKIRAWYYNKNDELLGTDILKAK